MARWRPECPRCGSKLDISKLKYGIPFPCPSCKTPLYIRGFYFWLPALAAVLLCGLLGYSFGFRFWELLLFMAVFQFPAGVFFMLVLTSNFNPKIEEHYPDYLDLKPHF